MGTLNCICRNSNPHAPARCSWGLAFKGVLMKLHHQGVAGILILKLVKRLTYLSSSLPGWLLCKRAGCEMFLLCWDGKTGSCVAQSRSPGSGRPSGRPCAHVGGAAVGGGLTVTAVLARSSHLAFSISDCRRKPKSWQRSRRTCKYGPVIVLPPPLVPRGAQTQLPPPPLGPALCFHELWCWRRLLRVPWTARSSSWSILKRLSVSGGLSPCPQSPPAELCVGGVCDTEWARPSRKLSPHSLP